MLVNKRFLIDFAYLANRYGWDGAELEDVKEQTRQSAELRRYWTELAAAHRAGYEQTRANQWMRLEEWKRAGAQLPDTTGDE